MNVRQLKSEARENAGADNVGDHNPARGHETDGSPRRRYVRGWKLSDFGHGGIDNPEIIGSREFFFGEPVYSRVVRTRGSRHFGSTMKTILSLETTTQLAVFLENRPGALARVCEALAKAGINIHALTVSDTVDHAVVRMIVSDPTKALMLLGERGVLAFENDVLMIDAPNEMGVLGKIADALSLAEVNIEYAYFATGGSSPKGIIVLRPSDIEKARQALSNL